MLRRAGALFLVNDHADIAAAVDADGVHLGQEDLPAAAARRLLGRGKLIGISTHDLDQARAAEGDGADYIGFGPLFSTTTKNAGQGRGTERLNEIRRAVALPVIAIGGITAANAGSAVAAGADGIAVISAVLGAEDIGAAAADFLKALQIARAARGG